MATVRLLLRTWFPANFPFLSCTSFAMDATMQFDCTGCSLSFYIIISNYFRKEEEAITFFRNHGVLPSAVECPNCKEPCTYTKSKQAWRCRRTITSVVRRRKTKKTCTFQISDRKGTFLEKTKLASWQVLHFTNAWLDKSFSQDHVMTNLGISNSTVVDWNRFCFEVVAVWYENQESVGGDQVIVEIDETLFVKRKYNRGRILKEVWLFGGIERTSKRAFIVALDGDDDDRSAAGLLPIIKKFIKPGSIIVSDKWKAYSNLNREGYTHWSVNHSKEFVAADDERVHTQNIERLWQDLKERTKRPGNVKRRVQQYLARYLFVKTFGKNCLHEFLHQAALLYPHASKKKT